MKKKIITVIIIVAFVIMLILLNMFLKGQNTEPPEKEEHKIEILEVTSQTFEQEVLKSEKPVLIDFYAQWCGPCKILSPRIEEIANENEAVKFVKIDIDKAEELAIQYEIMSIPTLVFIENGEEKDRLIGLVNKSEILDFIGKE